MAVEYAGYQRYQFPNSPGCMLLKVDEFKPVSPLGEGTYGLVWKCEWMVPQGADPSSSSSSPVNVAVKQIKVDRDEPQKLLRLLREIKLMKHLDHEGIVRLLSIMKPPEGASVLEEVYLVMELMEWDLAFFLHPKPKPEQDAYDFTMEDRGGGFGFQWRRHTLVGVEDGSPASRQGFARLVGRKLLRVEDEGAWRYPDGSALLHRRFSEPGAPPRLSLLFEPSKPPLSTLVKQAICWQLLDACQTMHACGVLHRDLKPQNILINSDTTVKICDFGLAHELDEDLTVYVETRWYRAPELILEVTNYDSKVDIWSLGCVFYELLEPQNDILLRGLTSKHQLELILNLTGPPPQEKLAAMSVSQRIQENIFAYTPQTPPPVLSDDPLAADLLSKMLTFLPEDRYSAAECLAHPFFDSYKEEMFSDEEEEEEEQQLSQVPTVEVRKMRTGQVDVDYVFECLHNEIQAYHPSHRPS